METIVTQIIENWKTLSPQEFDEYMLNQQRTLIREEMEQIIDAWESGKNTNNENCEDFDNGKQYFFEYYKR